MSDFFSTRYGDLAEIGALTGNRCHLCHESVDLDFYGPPGSFGLDTVTVDHLFPQAHGGDDDSENLRLAHASCNSRRGTRDAEDVRLELVGTDSEPLGTNEKSAISLGLAGLGYLGGGRLFANRKPDGAEEFNHAAAVLTALAVAILAQSAL